MNDPLVTVVTPTLDCAATIGRCLQSVQEQNLGAHEHLVVDGSSTDGTLERLRAQQRRDPRLQLIVESDQGIYDAMNKGVARARGEWIYFLGGDDALRGPEVLRIALAPEHTRNADVVYGDVRCVPSGVRYAGSFTPVALLARNICHQAIFLRRRLVERLGGFDVRYCAFADWAFNMRWMSDRRVRRRWIDLVVADYDERGFSREAHDAVFEAERPSLERQHFSRLARLCHRHRDSFWSAPLARLAYGHSRRARAPTVR